MFVFKVHHPYPLHGYPVSASVIATKGNTSFMSKAFSDRKGTWLLFLEILAPLKILSTPIAAI